MNVFPLTRSLLRSWRSEVVRGAKKENARRLLHVLNAEPTSAPSNFEFRTSIAVDLRTTFLSAINAARG